jgi:hypothetical protein
MAKIVAVEVLDLKRVSAIGSGRDRALFALRNA